MVNMSSPFDSGWKDTTPQSPSVGTSNGPVPSQPPADYPNNLVITEVGTQGASFDDTFREAIVNSTSTVTDLNPGGSAPCDTPFKDGLAKY